MWTAERETGRQRANLFGKQQVWLLFQATELTNWLRLGRTNNNNIDS